AEANRRPASNASGDPRSNTIRSLQCLTATSACGRSRAARESRTWSYSLPPSWAARENRDDIDDGGEVLRGITDPSSGEKGRRLHLLLSVRCERRGQCNRNGCRQ